MTTEEFSARLNNFRAYLQDQFSRDLLLTGTMRMAALINNRVEQKGLNSVGQMFSPYSAAYLKYKKKNKANKFKNFSDTRVMWKDFGVKKEEQNKITLGGKSQESQDKINWNSSREQDNIINPSQQEIDLITKYISDGLTKKMKEILL